MVAELWLLFGYAWRPCDKAFDWHWQEGPLGYSGPCSVFPTALNNHAGEHLLGVKSGQSLSCSRPSQALSIDKWACPSIEIVEMQQATSAGAGIQLARCKPRL